MENDDVRAALREGDLQRARALAVESVKRAPDDPGARAFLFQLSAIEGDWARADKQLDVLAELKGESLDLVGDYKAAIAAEATRREVMAGRAAPTVFGEPATWVAKMIEALRLDATGKADAAHALREEAFEEAAPSSGEVDGETFAWMADADQRFGPLMEAVINGEYHWIPFEAIKTLDMEPPKDLRDVVWAVGVATFANGGSWPILAHTLYPGSDPKAGGNAGQALGRRTDWSTLSGEHCAGLGQRMFATDTNDFPILEIVRLAFDRPTAPSAQG